MQTKMTALCVNGSARGLAFWRRTVGTKCIIHRREHVDCSCKLLVFVYPFMRITLKSRLLFPSNALGVDPLSPI